MGEAKTHKNTSPQTTKPWTATGKHCINKSGRILGEFCSRSGYHHASHSPCRELIKTKGRTMLSRFPHWGAPGQLQLERPQQEPHRLHVLRFHNSYIGILSSTCTNEMQYTFLYICTYIVKGSLYITMYLYIYVNIYILYVYIYIHIKNTVYILPVYCIQHTHVIVQMFSIAKVHN